MIKEAKNAGCDIVKFQLLDMDEVDANDPEYDWFAKLDLAPPKINQLINWAEEEKIEILFTPVSVRTAQWLVDAGIETVKIASSFVNKTELIQYINNHFKTVYASTGMASLDEIKNLVKTLDKVKNIIILHCISEYPTGPLLEQRGLKALDEEDAHLAMINILNDMYPNLIIGYSDHTDDIIVPIIAVAMGAKVIEKHFTLDRKTPIEHYVNDLEYMGTDHILSVEPDMLNKMVHEIRRTEKIIGEPVWSRSKGEIILMEFLRGRYQERKNS
jgi:sialic acid synthase SpsE